MAWSSFTHWSLLECAIDTLEQMAAQYNAERQIAIVGLLAFCGPGMFNVRLLSSVFQKLDVACSSPGRGSVPPPLARSLQALNGLGNAGSGSASVAAMANGSLYCTFAVCGYFAGAAFNLVGPLPLFVIGGLTYALYAAAIYFTEQISWLAAVGGAVLGVGAGLFWTAQVRACAVDRTFRIDAVRNRTGRCCRESEIIDARASSRTQTPTQHHTTSRTIRHPPFVGVVLRRR